MTAPSVDRYGNPVICKGCSTENPNCWPIQVPLNDTSFNYGECIPFVRSGASLAFNDCKLSRREQLDLVTQWIDSSSMYGQDSETSHDLRTHEYGMLKTSKVYIFI